MLRLTCLASTILAVSSLTAANAQAPAKPTANPNASTDPLQQTQDVMLHAKVLTEDTKNNLVIAEGDVEVRVGARVLKADKLVYDREKGTMRASGHIQMIAEDGTIQFSDEIEGDDNFRNGFATRFSTRLIDNSLATASSAIRQDGNKNILDQIVYTGCTVCTDGSKTPTWALRARRAVLDEQNKTISYQDAVLEIKGIPVLYIPYFAHPEPSAERQSGLLIPDVGNSSKLGLFYEQPYYWSISPSQDLTISPMISTNVNPLLKLNYRKKFFSGYIEADASATYEQDFDSKGNKFGDETWRSHLYALGAFNIDNNWKWGFGVERQSDDLYDRRYDIDGEDQLRGLWASQPRQLVSQLYTTGQYEDFYLEAGVLDFQGLRAGDDDAKFPRVAPTLYMDKVFDFGANGQVSTKLSTVALFRDSPEQLQPGQFALDTARATGSAEWNAQYVFGPGLLFSPFASGRADYYNFDEGQGAGRETVSRFLGLGGAQVSMPFIRRGKNVDLMVEPIAMVAYGTPNANDDGVPNEDSLLIEADESNLFKPNAVTNYDLWEGGLRAALGLSASAEFGKGNEVTAMVGQRWRADKDPAFNQTSNLSDKKSDYVASVRADLGPVFNASVRTRFDKDLNFNRIDLSAGANIWRVSGNARYFRVVKSATNTIDEAIAMDGQLKVTDHWSASYVQARNITNQQDILLQVGAIYHDDCTYFAIFYRRNGGTDRTLKPNWNIGFTLSLKGLGNVGDNSFD